MLIPLSVWLADFLYSDLCAQTSRPEAGLRREKELCKLDLNFSANIKISISGRNKNLKITAKQDNYLKRRKNYGKRDDFLYKDGKILFRLYLKNQILAVIFRLSGTSL